MTRAEHMQFCKDRALAELGPDGGGPVSALASMRSDLSKHPETRQLVELCLLGMFETTDDGMRHFIEGFN